MTRIRGVAAMLAIGVVLVVATAGSALAVDKTYTFSGTSNLACPDFACSDFVVSVKSVAITGGTWTKVANSETSSHKKVGTVTDCEYPDVGTVSVTFNDNVIDANDQATIVIQSTSTKVIGGGPVTCRQEKTVNITGATGAAVTVNFDTKEALPGAGPMTLAAIAGLLALAGVVVARKRALLNRPAGL